ncbi:MAG: hypothetical protein KY468_05860 [Armatimonadetes bacterium]|nr:hypothetical protein [Armatimonadota bacterium]
MIFVLIWLAAMLLGYAASLFSASGMAPGLSADLLLPVYGGMIVWVALNLLRPAKVEPGSRSAAQEGVSDAR